MARRVRISLPVQTEVLTKSRRRCCICFGLNRDESIKKGQIVHLDGDPNNNDIDNLAFLCLDHHDELDSSTSQSKGLSAIEVKGYREELYRKFSFWGAGISQHHLLKFLAHNIDLDVMVDAAVKIGGRVVFYGANFVIDVLTTKEVTYSDWDLIGPHLVALDYFADWGWLTYEYEELEIEGFPHVHIVVDHDEICKKIAERIGSRADGQNQNV